MKPFIACSCSYACQVKKLSEFARTKYQCSVGQLALAWCVKNKNVSTVLLGATKPDQLHENLGAIAVARKITAEDMKEIDEILGSAPEGYNGWGGKGMRAIDKLPGE